MYFMLTNYCNLECEHCCYNCGPYNKDYMSLRVFKKALKICKEYDEHFHITLGGGEPLFHPKFREIFLRACGFLHKGFSVSVITNGTVEVEEKFLEIAPFANTEGIYIAVSDDLFHGCVVSEKVQKAIKQYDIRIHGPQDIDQVIPVGRAIDIVDVESAKNKDDCPCGELHVTPTGEIYLCGHLDYKLGTVYNFNAERYEDLSEQEVTCSKEIKS